MSVAKKPFSLSPVTVLRIPFRWCYARRRGDLRCNAVHFLRLMCLKQKIMYSNNFGNVFQSWTVHGRIQIDSMVNRIRYIR